MINKYIGILSFEYIRGLVEGEGCFTFDKRTTKYKKSIKIEKIPTFVIQMHERDRELLRKLRNTLGLPNSIYILGPYRKDGINRGRMAKLIVRDYISLKDKIIPLFYKKLHGYKAKQFMEWLENIGNSDVLYPYRNLYKLYKSGFFDENIHLCP
ncbi:hypothetical protein A3G50_01220 [Candidatus Jorgensenbacteria bacterium RIFCSPLOWO2_12_FULL_42_11]|uniref:Homing endonuclease LAGLIDADG domain-containing protein n=1 Tax=Candidatus Jorgensenbacteria bacterium RIFCSPLOWO2_12_FULL_42_11 TaxID=1798473 RepID=A0A1F6C221_9BACT|nr:MAG: hypothetical protein A3G50_01220 [Candidatus Jorgensenbacteria bacterium RIFCSPLOWO2_12_FULL_42_11]